MSQSLLRVEQLSKIYRQGQLAIHAVNDVSFELFPGETLGLVGESGCGKTTTARCILGLEKATTGSITFDGLEVSRLSARELRRARRHFQMVFQDPNESLNPRFTVRRTLREPLVLHGLYRGDSQLVEAVQRVNLEVDQLSHYQHQLSGGQKQRVGVARAMMTRPQLVVLDEPTSSLDMSLRIHVLALLRRLQREFRMTYLFISHDLSTVRHLCDRVLVMYLGRIVEMGPTEDVFSRPRHVYTQALLSAIPIPDPTVKSQRILLEGETSNARESRPGCSLQDRCPYVAEECLVPVPFYDLGSGHRAACRLAKEDAVLEPLPSRS